MRALAVSLVQFSSGYRVDLAALRAATRRTGAWLVVDAIQGVGQVPVDLRAHAGGRAGLRRAEVAALAVGIGLRLRAARADRASSSPPVTGWMAFEGTDDLTRLTTLQRHPAGRRPAVRADHAPVPGFRRHERLARPDAGARAWSGSQAHLQRLHAARAGLGRAERDAPVASPLRRRTARASSASRRTRSARRSAGSRRRASSAACARARSA